jgi:hypothetical protein
MSSVPTEGTHCGWLAACSGGGAASGDVASSVETRRCRSSCSLRSPTPPLQLDVDEREAEALQSELSTATRQWWRTAARGGTLPVAGYENEGVN